MALAIVVAVRQVGAMAAEPAADSETAVKAPAGWKLVWSDEFDGPRIDNTKWDFDQGNGFKIPGSNTWVAGWGNGELEYYTSRPENAFLKDGMLHIRALK